MSDLPKIADMVKTRTQFGLGPSPDITRNYSAPMLSGSKHPLKTGWWTSPSDFALYSKSSRKLPLKSYLEYLRLREMVRAKNLVFAAPDAWTLPKGSPEMPAQMRLIRKADAQRYFT